MIRGKSSLFLNAHKLLDICLTVMAFVGAYFIKKYLLPYPFRGLTTVPNYYIVLLMIIIIWYLTFEIFGLYVSFGRQPFGQIFWGMTKAVSIGMIIMIFCMYIFKITDVSRIMIGLFFLLDISMLGLNKYLIYTILIHYRKRGYNIRNILIVGSGEQADNFTKSVGNHPGAGYRVLGCVDNHKDLIGKKKKSDTKFIGTLDSLEEVLLNQVVDELVFTKPLSEFDNVKKYLAMAEEIGIPVRIIPDLKIKGLMYQPGIAHIQFENFIGIPTIAFTTTSSKYGDLVIKTLFDYLFAVIFILILSPLFILISITIKLSSRGPILFQQERSGLNGRKFMLYKFRTMLAEAETLRNDIDMMNESDGPVFKVDDDPRIIPIVGKILRKTSLDELPQLINVLKGEMSVVGPRPPIPNEVERYDVWQRRRLSVKPGLTCLWQIIPHRNKVTFKEWMKLDLQYIDNWSLKLDFSIMLRTVWVVLTGSGK